MTKIENFKNAYKEVYIILNNMNNEDIRKIPHSFFEMIKSNMNEEYSFELKENVEFEEQALLRETKAILAYIFMNYWGTEEEKNRIKEKFRRDIIKEEQLKQKYKMKNLYKKTEIQKTHLINDKKDNTQLVILEKENILIKLLRKIKAFFIN